MNLQIITPQILPPLTLQVESNDDLISTTGSRIITFGKYKGYSVSEVYEEEKGYLYWCIKTPGIIRRHYDLTTTIREYVKYMKQKNHSPIST